jgi:hypothetical protein
MANHSEVMVDRNVYIEELQKLKSDPKLLVVEKKEEKPKNKK